mgnify:CR=1 FL=1
MFDNYSIADLFANIYKKRVVNTIAVILIFCVIAIPYTYKAINNKTIVKDASNYSSYISYKIQSPLEEQKNFNKNQVGGYGDFYGKLIESNLNGAFLFNDLSDSEMKKIAAELDTAVTTLKNSNFDYWEKKIVVNSLVNNAGVTVKILTPSKMTNDIIEKKLDLLVDKFKDTYTDVKIQKLDTVNSKELITGSGTEAGTNKSVLIIRLAILGILSIILVIFGNIAAYIFNPTINRAGDFSKFGIDFITKIDSIDYLKEIIQYKNGNSSLVIIGSNKKVLDKFSREYKKVLTDNITLGDIDNVKDVLAADSMLFVEEYGVTRYKNFEETLQIVQNLNKKVMGVLTYKL